MFDIVSKNKLVVKIVLAIIILPFAFFGIDSYFRDGGNNDFAAKIDETVISSNQYYNYLRSTRDRMRSQLGENKQLINYLDTIEFKKSVLNEIVERILVLKFAEKNNITVSKEEIRSEILKFEVFKDDEGFFSASKYNQLLTAQNLQPEEFEIDIKQGLILRRIEQAFGSSAFISKATSKMLIRIKNQEREFSKYTLLPKFDSKKNEITEKELLKYYEDNQDSFLMPERLKVEYISFSEDLFSNDVYVSDSELKDIYETNKADYLIPEQRKASHILFTKEQIKEKKLDLDEIVEELRNNTDLFFDYVNRYSYDDQSKKNGGSLGFFEKGANDKIFDEAVFSLNLGEISDPITSSFGVHIIFLEDIKKKSFYPFEQIKQELNEKIVQEKKNDNLDAELSNLIDLVYEGYDNFSSASEKYDLEVKTSNWFSKGSPIDLDIPSNEELDDFLFSYESTEDRRNSEPIEVKTGLYVSARVVDYLPKNYIPFENLREEIEDLVNIELSIKANEESGMDLYQKIIDKNLDANINWSKSKKISLDSLDNIEPDEVKSIFDVPAGKLPGYSYVKKPDGTFILFKVNKIKNILNVDESQINSTLPELSVLQGKSQFGAFMKELRKDFDIEVNDQILNAEI